MSQISCKDEDEESDSDEESSEETEKENARNKLKALLGGSNSIKKKLKLSTSHSTALRKSSSYNESDESSPGFIHALEKMKIDLYTKLELPLPDDDESDDDVDVSKIFYEGREGQKFTVRVLDKFFSNLKNQAQNYAHNQKMENEQAKVSLDREGIINNINNSNKH